MNPWFEPAPSLLEVVPPPLRLGDAGVAALLAEVGALLAGAAFHGVNIPEIREERSKSALGTRRNPYEPRVEPRELARRIQEQLRVPAIVNRVVVHHPAGVLRDWFLETHERFGVESFVLVGGESPSADYPGPSVPRANELLRRTLPHSTLHVGNISIPGRSAEIDEAERMRLKVESGCDFFTTQIVYHADEVTSLLDSLGRTGADVARTLLVASLCPLRSPRSVDFLRFLGVSLRDATVAELTRDPDRTLERSEEHLVALWDFVGRHRAAHRLATPLGLNIAPIGRIPVAATLRFARRLHATAHG